MTKRRFTLDDEGNGLCRCILVDGEEMPTCEICELLNEQQDIIQSLKEENEKLIQKKCFPCELVSLQTREIDKLKDENEQLKRKLEDCEFEHFLDGLGSSNKWFGMGGF